MKPTGEESFAKFEQFGDWAALLSFGTPEVVSTLSNHTNLLQRYVLDENGVVFREGKIVRFPIYEDNDVRLRDMWLYGLRTNIRVPPGTSTKPIPDTFFFAFLFSTADPRIATTTTIVFPGAERPQKTSLVTEILAADGSVVGYDDTQFIGWTCGQMNMQIRSFKSEQSAYEQFSKARLRPFGGEYFRCS